MFIDDFARFAIAMDDMKSPPTPTKAGSVKVQVEIDREERVVRISPIEGESMAFQSFHRRMVEAGIKHEDTRIDDDGAICTDPRKTGHTIAIEIKTVPIEVSSDFRHPFI